MLKKVAAVQMAARIGDVDYNLDHIRELSLEAIHQGAKIIALPEFFTSSIILDERVYNAILPPENAALDLLMELASDHQVIIGGSYLEKREGHVYNSYKLVGPDGLIGHHDKDQPTMVENAYYIGGTTDGVHKTDQGRIGTAVCWETIRSRTVRRLANHVDFLMTGSHWWTAAENWGALKDMGDIESRSTLKSAPGELAKRLNVANIHASHCGDLSGRFAVLPYQKTTIPVKTSLIGEAQIVNNRGQILARRSQSEGPGVICATLDLQPFEGQAAIPASFWMPKISFITKLFWWHQNWVGRILYRKALESGKI